MTRLVLSELFVTNLLLSEHQQKTACLKFGVPAIRNSLHGIHNSNIELENVLFKTAVTLSVTHTTNTVYDILPSTTASVDYAIGLEELSDNGQFFVGAH